MKSRGSKLELRSLQRMPGYDSFTLMWCVRLRRYIETGDGMQHRLGGGSSVGIRPNTHCSEEGI